MLNSFTFLVGARYGVSRRHSQLVSFISSLSIAGLIIGVALLVLVMSIMNGFDRELRERILGILPQAMIFHREGIAEPQALIEDLLKHPQVVAAAPFVQLQGLLAHQKQVSPVNVYGIDPDQEIQLSSLKDFLPQQALQQLAGAGQGVVIGKGIADKLDVEVGDSLTLIIPRSGETRLTPNIRMLEVLAIFDSGTEIDHGLALMNLQQASQLSPFPGRVSGIRLQVDDLFNASPAVHDIVSKMPYGFYGTDWTRTQGNLYEAIHMSKSLVEMLLSLIIAIAAFNLVSTLIMVVVDKQSDIAILRTLGASTREIISIFMVQGGLIGLIGISVGVVLGVLLSLWVTDVVQWLERALDVRFLQSDVYPISYLPSDLQWPDVVQVALTALVISFLAALYPAWRASRVQPADALRYE